MLTFKLAFFDYPHAYTFISIPDAAKLIYFLKSTVFAIDLFVRCKMIWLIAFLDVIASCLNPVLILHPFIFSRSPQLVSDIIMKTRSQTWN